MIKAFDCSTPLTASVLKRAVAEGHQAVGRYYGTPGSSKLLTPAEARLISDARLTIFCYFERTAGRALEAGYAGAEDGVLAGEQARSVGQPEGTGITFAVDVDAAASPAIISYFASVRARLVGYRVGVYAGGDVIKAVRAAGVAEFGILAGAMGWRGSRAYRDSGMWQGLQHPATRSTIGIWIDPVDLVGLPEVGAWSLASAAVEQLEDPKFDILIGEATDVVRDLQDAAIARKVQTFLNSKGALLRADGDFGPLSWAALGNYLRGK